MFGRCTFSLLTVIGLVGGVSAWGVTKGSAKRELQELVRSPRVEFPVPLEFHRRFGFVAFPELPELEGFCDGVEWNDNLV